MIRQQGHAGTTVRSDLSKAQAHILMAERAAADIDDIAPDTPRIPVHRVGILGAGTMGGGIAMNFLSMDIPVTIVERDQAPLDRGIATIRRNYERAVSRGRLTQADVERAMALLTPSLAIEDFASSDLIIEAVFENMAVKKDVFRRLDAIARPGAILASNTSRLDIDVIAAETSRPEAVIGLHFFSPAHIMKLLEIVRTDVVAPDVLATGFAFAARLGKIAVLSGVCDDFIGNRIMSAYRRECEFMLEEGALPDEIDAAMTDFGFPLGIFAMQDLAGLDIGWAMRKRQAQSRDPDSRYVAIADRLCELGRFGRKTGAGYYRYADGSAQAVPDPVTEAIILEESAAKAIVRRRLSAAEIIDRILGAMQAEGARVVSEGIAASAAAIDVVMINGYSFPRWRGGPMYMRANRS